MALTLVFGNKNYSSWSLRPWLLLRHFGLPFHEKRVALFTPQARETLAPLCPTGCVPVLLDDSFAIWDSLAICEYVSEQFLAGKGWPAGEQERARARSLAAEMHSGFHALRSAWPMNVRLRRKLEPSDAVQKNITRIESMWSDCLQASGGPWLFGEFGIVDAMYAPVVLRFHSYQPSLDEAAQAYMDAMLAHPSIQEWMEAALQESETIKEDEVAWLLGEASFD